MDYCECVHKKTIRTRQELTQLKSPISLKLGANDDGWVSLQNKEESQVLPFVEFLLVINRKILSWIFSVDIS